jgi:hypothetical protein
MSPTLEELEAIARGATQGPCYIRQSGDTMTDEEGFEWFQAAGAEARQKGCTFARFSYHPDIPNLRIVEGWIARPTDQGDIRWALTFGDTASRTASGEAAAPPPDAELGPGRNPNPTPIIQQEEA